LALEKQTLMIANIGFCNEAPSMIEWLETFGDSNLLILTGALVGLTFGVFAQQSQFCLRSATLEFWRFKVGKKLSIWLVVFASAFLLTQLQISAGSLEAADIRQLANPGSLSGAMVGGAMFGIGMILARGCASRLLILSGTGNLRAFTTGLIVTVVAQSSITGVLSPLREWLSGLWMIDADSRYLVRYWPEHAGLALALLFAAIASFYTYYHRLSRWVLFASVMTGVAVALGWFLTSWHASWSFEIIKVQSVTFTGPSADTLMALINSPNMPKNFATGLVPGVFFGSMVAALLTQQFQIQKFTADTGMVRYLIGALLMGFGGMLAGGCAVGAGITGGSVLAVTAWLALLFMWLGAGFADRFLVTETS
jgi:uncharacterized membrane protein YedE/YeeE